MPNADRMLLATHLRRAAAASEAGSLTDQELVGRFVGHSDAAAFEVLVRRHGPMVWATCRRILRHQHDAEDAFQATFLTLTRAARSIGNKQAVGSWLHRVAANAALKLRARRIPARLTAELPALPKAEPGDGEFAGAVDEELDRLSDRVRAVFVLCCLEGLTSVEAARELGCPVGTVDSRLHAARTRLRDRLIRRGFGPSALSALTVAGPVPPDATAAVTATGALPPRAVDLLANQVERAMRLRMQMATMAALGIVVLGLGGAVVLAFSGPPITATQPVVARSYTTAIRPAPIPADAARDDGRIVLWREGHPLAINPRTKGTISLVTGFEGKRGTLRLGPDGRSTLVCPNDPDDRDRLYLRVPAGDGKELQLKEVEVNGVFLCHAFWGADGKAVYGYGLTRPVGNEPAPKVDLTKDLVNWSFDLRTGKVEKLKLPGVVSVLDRSADGKAFLVLRYHRAAGTPGDYTLGLLPADGGPLVPLAEAGQATPGDFRFSPDGRFALGTMYRTVGGEFFPELVVIDLKTLTRKAVGVPKNARVCGAGWSPDGKRVAVVWESQEAYENRAKKQEEGGKGLTGRVVYELTITVSRPDGSDAKDIYTESGYWHGSIDWR